MCLGRVGKACKWLIINPWNRRRRPENPRGSEGRRHLSEWTARSNPGAEIHGVRPSDLLHFHRASSMLCDSVMTDISNQRRP